jgi:hypothetical protein
MYTDVVICGSQPILATRGVFFGEQIWQGLPSQKATFAKQQPSHKRRTQAWLADVVAVHGINVHLLGHIGRQKVHGACHGVCAWFLRSLAKLKQHLQYRSGIHVGRAGVRGGNGL